MTDPTLADVMSALNALALKVDNLGTNLTALQTSQNTKLDAIATTANHIDTTATDIKANTVSITAKLNIQDEKLDLLAGDNTTTNVLDEVLAIKKKVSAIEFKSFKGK